MPFRNLLTLIYYLLGWVSCHLVEYLRVRTTDSYIISLHRFSTLMVCGSLRWLTDRGRGVYFRWLINFSIVLLRLALNVDEMVGSFDA